MLVNAPDYLFAIPGIILIILGVTAMAFSMPIGFWLGTSRSI